MDNPLLSLTQQIQALQTQLQDMQRGTTKRYSLQDIFPYPFYRNVNMIPFPPNFLIPKYEKYNGRTGPQDNVRQICTMSIDFSLEDTYLMRLFLKSLSGQAMEWFCKLLLGIKFFEELVSKFVSQYSYNIQYEISMLELCNTKLKNGKIFMLFLQRWRQLFTRYPCLVPNNKKMDIFIDNLNDKMSYVLKLKFLPSFDKMFDNGINIEDALVEKGVLKLHKEGTNSSNNNNTVKLKFCNKNINIVNDGIVDVNNVKPKKPIFNPSSHTLTTNQDNNK